MAIVKSEVDEIVEERGTDGGTTYQIKRKGDDEYKALCYRRFKGEKSVNENGERKRCSRPAGWGTTHVGTGPCKLCGGSSIPANITNGKTAYVTKGKLAEEIQQYLDKGKIELRDLTYELAATKLLLKKVIEQMPGVDDDNFGRDLYRVNNLVQTVSSLVDKISRIEARDTLTVHQVIYFRSVIVDILGSYVKDPQDLELALNELVERVGGKREYIMIEPPDDNKQV